MGGHLLEELRDLLRALDVAQRDLSALQKRKRAALSRGQTKELLEFARNEASLGNRLRAVLNRRARILDLARQAGLQNVDTLESLVARFGPETRAELEPRIQQARRLAAQIRRETWVQWIVAQRAHAHYSSMLELIATSGARSPTYEARPARETSGGALFDASV